MFDFTVFDTKGLDYMYQIYESICENLAAEIQAMEDKSSVTYREKIGQLAYQLQQFQYLTDEINKRRSENFLFSVEDIYKVNGQEDKYSIFRFYRTSEAFKKYGEDAYGWLLYSKKQREALEEAIAQEKYNRTDGKILLKAACKDPEKARLLETEGFLASDVSQVFNMDHHDNREKQYKKEGLKQIPNTIHINFNAKGFDHDRMNLWLTSRKIEDGYTLLKHELSDYYGSLSIIQPETVTAELKAAYLLKADKSGLLDDVDIKICASKYRRGTISPEEKQRFAKLLKDRRLSRFEIIRNDIGASNAQMEKFSQVNPEHFEHLLTQVYHFSTETLSQHKTAYPVYWDFERFAHIYMRHYKEFIIDGTTVKGTKFQYTYKDIRRLVCLILENLKDEIEASLSQGKPYAKYGDQGYYFNGNFFTLRIAPDGKLMQFHPQ